MNASDVINTYDRVGATWAKQRNKTLMEKRWLDWMLQAAPHASGKTRVLDIGCGSGQPITSYLMERGVHVTGVDAAPTMTALFADTLPKATSVEADMRGLTLNQTFDAIVAWDSFFHLTADDQRPMFATFAKHAGPRSALMFTSGHLAGEAIGQVGGEPIYHASLSPDEYEQLLEDNGYRVLRYTPEDPDCGNHTVWLAQFQS